MRVLVTGGNGFIGKHVCKALERHGYEPWVFDRRVDPHTDVLGDIRDRTAVMESVSRVDGVIHLAGVLGTAETVKNPFPAVDVNIAGGLNVLEAVAAYPMPAVNIAVGNYWMANPYSITKNTIERFTDMYNQERGTKVATVRALNAYGPGQVLPHPYGPSRVRKIIPSFVGAALAGDPVEVYGSGEQIMDMVYVGDVAEVLVRALECNEPGRYEVGTGRPTTVNQIAGEVLLAVGKGRLVHREMRPGEPDESVVLGDPSTLKPLGFTEFVSLEEGMARTVESYR